MSIQSHFLRLAVCLYVVLTPLATSCADQQSTASDCVSYLTIEGTRYLAVSGVELDLKGDYAAGTMSPCSDSGTAAGGGEEEGDLANQVTAKRIRGIDPSVAVGLEDAIFIAGVDSLADPMPAEVDELLGR